MDKVTQQPAYSESRVIPTVITSKLVPMFVVALLVDGADSETGGSGVTSFAGESLGALVGTNRGISAEGELVGLFVKISAASLAMGLLVGTSVGVPLGRLMGSCVGDCVVMPSTGLLVGTSVGTDVGGIVNGTGMSRLIPLKLTLYSLCARPTEPAGTC